MSEALMEKIDRIDSLLQKLNAKIDNFLGFEELREKDKQKEVEALRKEREAGVCIRFDQAPTYKQ